MYYTEYLTFKMCLLRSCGKGGGGDLGLRSYTHETIRWDVVFKVEKLYLMLLSLLVYYLFFLQQNFVVDVSDL